MINQIPRMSQPAAVSPLQSSPSQNLRISAPAESAKPTISQNISVKTATPAPIGQSTGENDAAIQAGTPQPSENLKNAFSVLSGLKDGDVSSQDIAAFKQVLGGLDALHEGDRQAFLSDLGANIRSIMSGGGDPAAVLEILATYFPQDQNSNTQVNAIIGKGTQVLNSQKPTELPPASPPTEAVPAQSSKVANAPIQAAAEAQPIRPEDTSPKSYTYWQKGMRAVEEMSQALQNGKQDETAHGLDNISAEMRHILSQVKDSTQALPPETIAKLDQLFSQALEKAEPKLQGDAKIMGQYTQFMNEPNPTPDSKGYWMQSLNSIDSMLVGLEKGGHTISRDQLASVKKAMQDTLKNSQMPLSAETMDKLKSLSEMACEIAKPHLENDADYAALKAKVLDAAIVVAEKVKEYAVDGIDFLAEAAGPPGIAIKYGVHAIIAGIEGYTDNDGQGGVKGALAKAMSEIIGEAFGDLAGEGVSAQIKAAIASAVTKAAGDVLVGMQSNGGVPDFETFKATFMQEMLDSGLDAIKPEENFMGQKSVDELANLAGQLWEQIQQNQAPSKQ